MADINPNQQTPLSKETNAAISKKKTRRMVIAFIAAAFIAAAMLMCLPLLIEQAAKDALIKIPRGATREMVKDSIAKYLDD